MQKPFELQTAKRMRLEFQPDEDDELSEDVVRGNETYRKRKNTGEYEPLTAQLKRNF